jgi:hypothetical protein
MTSRMRVPSLKSQECPFEIHFNWINLKKHVVKKAKLPSDGSTEGWTALP